MLDHGNYKFMSYDNDNEFLSIPDLLPDDIDAEVLREYYTLITKADEAS
jgi:hypothetical protein